MSHEELYARLREIAPSVAFSARKEIDPYCRWDGDGEAPENMDPYNVDVRAETVANGMMVQGEYSLGGCWMEYGEEIGDVGGYLPQMLEGAAEELKMRLTKRRADGVTVRELDRVCEFLAREMRERYDRQREELAGRE